jgi:hypothetical protein
MIKGGYVAFDHYYNKYIIFGILCDIIHYGIIAEDFIKK